jgi:hypothetical protein
LWTEGHWVVAIGYDNDDPDNTKLIFEDPASFFRTWLSEGELIERWHDLNEGTAKGQKLVGYGCTLLLNDTYHHDRMDHGLLRVFACGSSLQS